MALLITTEAQRQRPGASLRLPSRRPWGAKFCALGVWLWLLGLVMTGPVVSRAEIVSHEYPLKAVFLLNFAHFTDWPANVITDPGAPFVIGVLGRDPFDGALDDAVRGESWNGHPIIIQRYRQMEELQTCQILFIGQSEARQMPKVMAALKGKPVLTVTDADSPWSPGVSVQFLTENNKIRFQINLDALKEAGLMMSSKLLRVAQIAPVPNK